MSIDPQQPTPEQVSCVINAINTILTAKMDAVVHPDYRGFSTYKLDVTADEVIAAMSDTPKPAPAEPAPAE